MDQGWAFVAFVIVAAVVTLVVAAGVLVVALRVLGLPPSRQAHGRAVLRELVGLLPALALLFRGSAADRESGRASEHQNIE